jgi:hypothetical protein
MADVIVAAAAQGHHDLRESTLILIAFCRGLRVSIVRAWRRVKRDDSETCATSYIKLLKLNELKNFRGLGLEPLTEPRASRQSNSSRSDYPAGWLTLKPAPTQRAQLRSAGIQTGYDRGGMRLSNRYRRWCNLLHDSPQSDQDRNSM